MIKSDLYSDIKKLIEILTPKTALQFLCNRNGCNVRVEKWAKELTYSGKVNK